MVGGKHNVLVYTMWMLVHLTHLVCLKSFQIRYFVFISDQKSSFCFCAFHNSEMNFIPHPQKKKSGRRQTQCSNTLYVDFSAPNLFVVVLCNTFKWDILWFILIKNLVIFVPTALAKWILFFNHSNKKVGGCQHNALVYCVDVSAPDLQYLVLSSATLSNSTSVVHKQYFWMEYFIFGAPFMLILGGLSIIP